MLHGATQAPDTRPERAVRHARRAYLEYYHRERNHQGVGHHLREAGAEASRAEGDGRCRDRLSGMLRYEYREAA